MGVLSGLEPKEVFAYFEKLCAVPHGSGNTKQISDLCASLARELGLPYRQDEHNNLVIWKKGSPGYEDAPAIILQGHLDMVCAKTGDCAKDMAREGLDLATDGEWVRAEKTSLGGDNCIAVAMILAILADEDCPHPPLEAVFTSDEEIGLVGAFAMDCSDLKGRQLLNLDSEEEGVFTVSCSGGVRLECAVPVLRVPAEEGAGYAVTVSGLKGGHSGVDIDKGRASANQLLVRVFYAALEEIEGLRVSDLRGGRFENVICPQSQGLVIIPADRKTDFEALIRKLDGDLKVEYAGCDEGVTLTCAPAEVPAALSREDSRRLLRTLVALPQGVQAMSMDFPGLVQTSLNLGSMGLEEDGFRAVISIRSCVASQVNMLRQRVGAILESGGGTVVPRNPYPGWQYQRESAMRDRLLAAHRDLSGQEGCLKATHGGLECGIFIEKLPGLDAVSLGPELREVHSPRERLSAASTQRVYRLVREFLRRSR